MNDKLKLTDFLDLETLQMLQDQLAEITGVRTSIRNAQGQPLTRPSGGDGRDVGDDGQYFAVGSIELDGRPVGSIVMEDAPRASLPSDRVGQLARQLSLSPETIRQVVGEFDRNCAERTLATSRFLQLLANAIARLCLKEYQLRQRVDELSTIYRVANELVGRNDLQQLLDLITKTVVEVMNVKAASLRLVDPNRQELLVKSVYGLSPEYLNKGPVLIEASRIDRTALAGEMVHIADLGNDARVLYPAQMKREGLISGLVCGLIYKDRPVGVIHLYTAESHRFSDFEVSLVRAIASQAATAIVNTELQIEAVQAEWMQRQLEVAQDVQRRMIPGQPPQIAGLDLAGLYTPCFELGGDFYDFIELPDGHLGVVIADVVGKGVAASLMMASVRSSLRAYAFQHRDIAELIGLVNRAMCRDTLANEFVTLFYGELDPVSLHMRYCNAGHNVPVLLRGDGQFEDLTVGGTIVGVFDEATYDVGQTTLGRGDVMLLYTDGLVDSMNFAEQRYELDRVRDALLRFRDQPARQILGNIRWEVRKFTGLTPRVDDLTMLALKVG